MLVVVLLVQVESLPKNSIKHTWYWKAKARMTISPAKLLKPYQNQLRTEKIISRHLRLTDGTSREKIWHATCRTRRGMVIRRTRLVSKTRSHTRAMGLLMDATLQPRSRAMAKLNHPKNIKDARWKGPPAVRNKETKARRGLGWLQCRLLRNMLAGSLSYKPVCRGEEILRQHRRISQEIHRQIRAEFSANLMGPNPG